MTLDGGTPTIDHEIGRDGSVAIRLASADIRLSGVDSDRVVVRTPSSDGLPDRVVVETTDGGLTIRERDSFGLNFSLGDRSLHLEIDVPFEATVTIDTASGSIEAERLRGEQRYRTASGDTRLHESAGRIELGSVSGDVEIELAGPTELAVKSVSGDVSVEGGSLTGLRIATTSGDIRVDSPITARRGNTVDTLSGDVSLVADAGMRIEARTVSGDLTSDLPHRSEGRMGRRTLIVGDGSIEVAFRSVSGDLQIHDARRQAGRSATATRPAPPTSAARPAVPPVPNAPDAPAAPGPSRGPADEIATDTVDRSVPQPTPNNVEHDRMAILRALETGDLDVATAMDALAALDEAEVAVQRASELTDV